MPGVTAGSRGDWGTDVETAEGAVESCMQKIRRKNDEMGHSATCE